MGKGHKDEEDEEDEEDQEDEEDEGRKDFFRERENKRERKETDI